MSACDVGESRLFIRLLKPHQQFVLCARYNRAVDAWKRQFIGGE